MESAAGDLVAPLAQQRAGPLQHLLGGSAREGEEQDRGRVNALLDHACHAVDQGACFAAARTGQNQQRSLVGDRGLVLGRVQLALVVDEKVLRPAGSGLSVQRILQGTALVAHLTALPPVLQMVQP